MFFDNHVHTEFSVDSEMKIEEALAAAKAQNIGLVFTEHFDCGCPEAIDFSFDTDEYWKQYSPFRGGNLRLGVEIGMCEGDVAQNEAFIARAPFDQVIGSIHVVGNRDIYYPEGYEGKTKEEIFGTYYRLMAEQLRKHPFVDILGHIDYICRYAPYDNPEVEYASFREEIDDVLRAAIETDTVMELNTRRLASRQALKELVPVYTRYKELGGQYISVGSDAHTADAIGNAFDRAKEFAEMIGLKPVTFCERKIQIVKY